MEQEEETEQVSGRRAAGKFLGEIGGHIVPRKLQVTNALDRLGLDRSRRQRVEVATVVPLSQNIDNRNNLVDGKVSSAAGLVTCTR